MRWVAVGKTDEHGQQGEGKTSSLSCLVWDGDLIVTSGEFPCTGDVHAWV